MLAKPGRLLFEQSTGSQNVNDGVATQRGSRRVFKSSVIVPNNTRHHQMIAILNSDANIVKQYARQGGWDGVANLRPRLVLFVTYMQRNISRG